MAIRWLVICKSTLLSFSVAPITGSYRKTISRLCFFVYWYRIGTTMKKAADTNICMYLEIHAHVHQMMFINA